jgi:hypothetical protein
LLLDKCLAITTPSKACILSLSFFSPSSTSLGNSR